MIFSRLRSAALVAVGLALYAAGPAADAHDTWFQAMNVNANGAILSLGTGNKYPQQDYAIGPEQIRQRGCRSADGRPAALSSLQVGSVSLIMRMTYKGPPQPGPARDLAAPVTCWAQLMPFDVEIKPDIVQVYFKDINASQKIKDIWADMQSRGVPWRERFTKHSRIELHAAASPAGTPVVLPEPTDMDMDVLLESGLSPIHPGDPLVFQVLRDGKPLPSQPMELAGAQGETPTWFQTDADGRVRARAPTPGRWILHGTDLRLSDTEKDKWDSRFVTIAFDVLP